jgi:radical SAM superfamily enzyme YgiQ (UPF0313 family)
MKLSLIHPCVGRFKGMKYLRAWQMEPLPMAQIAALTPKDIDIVFYDDRMEDIPYDEPTDLVGISIETYTAKRAYQIASEYRRRGVTVVMGGFHATLCPDEVAEYADAIVTGQAENVWETLLHDFQKGELKRKYSGTADYTGPPIIPDRSIYKDKNYLKIILLEAGRGCCFRCEFCSIQKFFEGKHFYRGIETVVKEIELLKSRKQLFFFVDDNITANQRQAKELFKALIPLKIKWVGQADITITHDDEMLKLMVDSGCQGILIGFESLNPANLKLMNKGFNQAKLTPEAAIKKIHKAGIIIYATFLHGYDADKTEDYSQIIDFCINNKLFMVGFNHVTPFPGTGLYERLEKENRLLYKKWWLDDNYTYGAIPYKTILPLESIEKHCRNNRSRFYSVGSILTRMGNLTNIKNATMFGFYFLINFMLRKDASKRILIPMGDREFNGEILKVIGKTK